MDGETLNLYLLEELARHIPNGVKQNRLYTGFSQYHYRCQRNQVNRLFSRCFLDVERYKDLHKDGSVFIVATGPSLQKTSLELLRDKLVMSVNSFYKYNVPISKYHVVGDGNFWNHHHKELLQIDSVLFLTEVAGTKYLRGKPRFDRFRAQYTDKPVVVIEDKGGKLTPDLLLSDPVDDGWYGRVSIMFSALRLAYYMGFKNVYLVGCDCSHKAGVHFDGSPSLGCGGVDWSSDFQRYNWVKQVFEEDKRSIFNCTVGGNLEVYPRLSLEEAVQFA